MAIEIKAGQWYWTRGGEIAYVAAILPFRSNYPVIGVLHGDVQSWTLSGLCFEDDGSNDDLIEHLPDCTGFDWVPPKPEPVYRAFANAAEFAPHADRWIVQSLNGGANRVHGYDNLGVWIGVFTPRTTYNELLQYRFLDGKTCGVLQ